MQHKSSSSNTQHSLGFSFVSGRTYYGHQKVHPLLAHTFLGVVEQYVLHPSLFFPILFPINLCIASSESSGT